MAGTITQFVRFASRSLRKLGVRVSVDVFGLAATRDLGIGQKPRRLAKYVDAVYPMVYPSHFNPGEYGLADPNANPGQTVTDALLFFEAELNGTNARLVPWLQDFSLGRTYTRPTSGRRSTPRDRSTRGASCSGIRSGSTRRTRSRAP